MNTDHHCPVCYDELRANGRTSYDITPETGALTVRLTTEPVSFATCLHGHKSALVVLDGAYAILFERALQRLATGNTRDAVIDAHTALEMYAAHVPARLRYDRELGVSPSALRKQLKTAVRTSERAFGAMLSALSLVTGEAPPKLPETATSLRNEAAHGGVYPSEPDAEKACLDIYHFITEIDRRLDAMPCVNGTSYWDASIGEEARACFERHKAAGVPAVHRAMATALAANRWKNRCTVTIEETIAAYRRDAEEGYPGWRVW